MCRTWVPALLAAGLVLGLASGTGAQEDEGAAGDAATLRAAGLTTDAPGLLAFFHLRSQTDVPHPRLLQRIEQLGSEKAATRLQAAAELVAMGPPAIPMLRQTAKDPDAPETAALARRCLSALEENSGTVTAAAVRQLARRHPPGTIEALLTYLPGAEDEMVLHETLTALGRLAHPQGKPDPALLRALEDEMPLRRAFAVRALCQDGRAEPRSLLRKLLRDPVPSVRAQAGLALARAWDAPAVSTLIALLPDLPLEQARDVEDYLASLADDQAPKVSLGTDASARLRCRDAWATWWLSSEGPGLLDELRKRTLTEENRIKAQNLVKKLGDDSFEVREQATNEIKTLGVMVVPMLRQALRDADVEVRQRAQACLQAVEKERMAALMPVTARLVALRKPAGAAEALLAFLPYAEEDAVAAEVVTALSAVAYLDSKADPAVLRGLQDKVAVRRAAAVEALCKGPVADYLPVVRPLLKDPDGDVRLRTAVALASAGYREGVPVLIDLVGGDSDERAVLAEEHLGRLAGDRGPDLPPGQGNRPRRREAWAAWWKANAARVELSALRSDAGQGYRGYTLLVQPQNNQVQELDTSGKVRWSLTGLMVPQDAEALPGGRVLVAEFQGQRVTERNLKGEVLWQKNVPSFPLSVQRLSNGHTFIVCRNLLLEVDRSGREVLSLSRPNDIMTARKLRDGQIVCISSHRTCFRLDHAGKEIKTFPLQAVVVNQNEVLPDGHILVPLTWNNKVIEYDAAGRLVWEVTVTQPMTAARLPNGNTLIAVQQWPAKVVEVDRSGKQVAEIHTTAAVARVRRR
jgi:HEAT repeat protein